jgi:hypothetical protein
MVRSFRNPMFYSYCVKLILTIPQHTLSGPVHVSVYDVFIIVIEENSIR